MILNKKESMPNLGHPYIMFFRHGDHVSVSRRKHYISDIDYWINTVSLDSNFLGWCYPEDMLDLLGEVNP